MRRVLWVMAVAGMAAGCGGGTEPVNPSPPPPPPPPAGPPASVAVQAGDNQTGEPGVKLATKASVIVRDAGGRAVANVPVIFAVDSGGGTLAGGQAASGADGVATAGDWILGPAEGTNVLLVTAAGLPPVRLRASGTYAGVTVSAGTLAVAGGKLTVDRPGSVLDGLEIEAGASVFASPVSFTVSMRSATGLSLPGGPPTALRAASRSTGGAAVTVPSAMIAVTPIITFNSNGPAAAAGEVLLRIPLPKNIGFNVVAAVVDSVGNPLAFLPAVAIDSISVTVTTRGLDQDLYARAVPASGAQARKLSIVVFAGAAWSPQSPTNQTMPHTVNANFTHGKDDFEFPDTWTAKASQIAIGMTLAEWDSNWLCQQSSCALHNTMQRAPGAWPSNTRGLMLSAGLTDDFMRLLGNYGAAWIKHYEQFNPAWYHFQTLTAVYWQLWYGKPTPLMLTDGRAVRMVMALQWNAATGTLMIRDPAFPSQTRSLQFVNWVMQPYPDPYLPSVVYTTPSLAQSATYAIWPTVRQQVLTLANASAPEPYTSVWPSSAYFTWDQVVSHPSGDRTVPDSLFMTGDTTRIWPGTQQAQYSAASGMPVPAGWSAQTAFIYLPAAGKWSYAPAWSGDATFIDARPGVNPNPWYQQSIGMALQRYEAPNSSAYSWLAWRRIDVVKYALKVADVADKPGAPVTLAITSRGGPTLPATATYEWNFNDQTALVRVTGPGPVTHTFVTKGTYAVDLKVLHGQTGVLIAKAKAMAEIADSAIFHIPQDTVEVILGSPVTVTVKNKNAPTPKPIRYEWSLDHVVGAFIVPTTVKVEGDSVLQHTWNELGTFAARVTVRDSVTNKILGQDTVQVNIGLNAWKFTSVSVQFSIIETLTGYQKYADSAVCYNCWKADSAMLVRLRDGINEGGILYLEKNYSSPWPGFLTNQGIYLLEGTDITEDRLSTHLDMKGLGVSGIAPAAGRITNQWLVFGNYQYAHGPPVDGLYPVAYSETGTLTNGSIGGTVWGPAQPGWWPYNVRQATVSFNGNVATGVLTYTFRIGAGTRNLGTGVINIFGGREAWRAEGRLVFTAQRMQ